MTGEIVNLRRVRKQRARAEAERQAATNRTAFGRSKSEKSLADAEQRRAEVHLTGHRLTRPDEP